MIKIKCSQCKKYKDKLEFEWETVIDRFSTNCKECIEENKENVQN